MSIVYGSFSQPIQSSAGSGFVNGTTDLYFTIPWHPASYVERIRIYNSTASATDIDSISILSNGAHVRENSAIVDDYIYFDTTNYAVAAATNYSAYYTIDPPLYTQELYSRPYLYVRVVLASNATSDYYYVTAIGRKAYPNNSYTRTDITGIEKAKDYRVIIAKNQSGSGGTGGNIYDVSGIAIKNGGENAQFLNFSSANDYIYVGSEKKIDHWEFVVGTASTNAGSLLGQHWNGANWSSFTVLDNTSSTGSNSMRFSGIVEGSGLGSSSWIQTKLDFSSNNRLPNDPLTVLEKQIIDGTASPIGFLYNPPRYWARFSLASLSDTAVINQVYPIYEQYH